VKWGRLLATVSFVDTLQVDGWAEFRAPARIGVLVRELRTGIAALLARKIADPAADVSTDPLVTALHQLLSTDGF
jgi:ATP-dependent RNA helicase DHX57